MLGSLDRALLYNFENKTNFVHNLFLLHLSISTCFEQNCAHHRQKNCVFAPLGNCYYVCMIVLYAQYIPEST